MALKVDPDGKVTVSLGGICTLKCRHCYTLTSSFQHVSPMSIETVVERLRAIKQTVKVICLSGDTDLFIDSDIGANLLAAVADDNAATTIMFTTRLVPTTEVRARVEATLERAKMRGQFIVPCISVVTLDYPNGVERSDLVPDGRERIAWLNHLANAGYPTILTLRPTFPFAIVDQRRIEEISEYVSPQVAAVLGEVFLLDIRGQTEKKLGVDLSSSVNRRNEMTFLDQTATWRKAYLRDEVEFHRAIFRARNLPYFLRSMSAIELIESKWRFSVGYSGLLTTDFIERRDVFP